MSQDIKVGIIGTGNIGSATLKYIDELYQLPERTNSYEITPIMVYDINPESLEFVSELKYTKPVIANSVHEVIDNTDIDIIVEATGQDEAARDIVLDSLEKGKSVVTPNKLILAKYSSDIFGAAKANNQQVGFESAVMGSVPVINMLRGNTDTIIGYKGILNGTSNLYLCELSDLGSEGAFQKAIDIGAAEPGETVLTSSDILGKDTANKNKILAMLSFGVDLDYGTVTNPEFMQGIQEIRKEDLKHAKELGYTIKLIGSAGKGEDGRIEFGTYPFLLPEDHMLSGVEGTFNALYINYSNRGKQIHIGKGAEPDPTKVAVVDDIIATARRIRSKDDDMPFGDGDIELVPPSELSYPFYIRFSAIDKLGVLSKLSGVLGGNNISIESVIQKGRNNEGGSVPIVMLTHNAPVGNVYNALDTIKRHYGNELLRDDTVAIRVSE